MRKIKQKGRGGKGNFSAAGKIMRGIANSGLDLVLRTRSPINFKNYRAKIN